MAETWLEELPTCLLFGDHRAGKKTHKRLAGSPREEKDPAAPTGPHAPIFCSPLSRNAGPVWLTPGPLPSENLPLKLITDKYQLVSSLQEVLGSGGGSELHLRRAGRRGSLRRGPALHHFLPPMAEAASTIGGGTALKVERLGVSFKPHADHGRGPGWAPQWTLGARTTSQPPTHFSSVAAGQFKAPRVTCPMWSLLICWASRGDTEPPAHICRAAGVGGAALSAQSAGVSTTQQLGNPRLPFCRASVSSGCCQESLLPEAQEGTGGYLLGGRSHSAKDRLCSQRQEKLGERIPRQPLGTRLFFWAGGTTSKGQTPGEGHTSTPRWHPLSGGCSEASQLGKEQSQCPKPSPSPGGWAWWSPG